MKTIDVVAAIIEKDGEILAHIENVDWLPADIKVVDALEKRGELYPQMALRRRRQRDGRAGA